MLVWRLLAYCFFITAIVLTIISLLQSDFTKFLLALFFYFLSSIILYTLKKFYQQPFQPNRTDYRKQRDNWWWDFLAELVQFLDIIIQLPIILFRMLLSILKYLNPFD